MKEVEAPPEIHIGEVFNITLEWKAKVKARSTPVTVWMDLG
jgi:hypothetical protein